MTRWKIRLLCGGLLVFIVALSHAETGTNTKPVHHAYNNPKLPVPENIVIVDVNYILSESDLSTNPGEHLATVAKMQAVEKSIESHRDELKRLDGQAKEQAATAAEQAELNMQRDVIQKLLATDEAELKEFARITKLHSDKLAEINYAIRDYTLRNNVNFVLNHCVAPAPHPDDMFYDNPPTREPSREREYVTTQMSQAVLYANPQSDITPWILKSMREKKAK